MKKYITPVLFTLLSSNVALADVVAPTELIINVRANIVASSCQLVGDRERTIDMGNVTADKLIPDLNGGSRQYRHDTPATFVLKCPQSTVLRYRMRDTTNGAPTGSRDYLHNSGTAQGIGVQLFYITPDGSNEYKQQFNNRTAPNAGGLPDGTGSGKINLDSNRSMTFKAGLYNINGGANITTGTVISQATMDIAYL